MGWAARHSVARVALWCTLVLSCPGAVATVFLRPALVFLAGVLGLAGVVVPANLLTRDRPPWHRCAPRHARGGYAGVDTDTRLRLADVERRLRKAEQAWTLAGVLRRGPGHHKRDFKVIDGGGESDDDPENSRVGLTTLHAAG